MAFFLKEFQDCSHHDCGPIGCNSLSGLERLDGIFNLLTYADEQHARFPLGCLGSILVRRGGGFLAFAHDHILAATKHC